MEIKKYSLDNGVLGGLNIINSEKEKKELKKLCRRRIKLTGKIHKDTINYQIEKLTQIVFELTEDCNLSCKYCAYGRYYNNRDNRNRESINWSTIKTAITYILNKKTDNSSLHIAFYGGEPLLKISLIKKTVEFCINYKDKDINFSYGFTTNGILLNKNIDFFVENKFRIMISIDGDKESNSFRVFNNGKQSFDVLIKNIKLIRDTNPVFFKENIRFNAVLHQKNSIPKIINYISNKFDKGVSIASISDSDLSPLYQDEFMSDLYNNYANDYYNSYKDVTDIEGVIDINPNMSNAVRLLNNFNSFIVSNYNNLLDESSTVDSEFMPTATCLPFEKKMFVSATGKILPCERINFKYALGKIENNKVILYSNDVAKKYNEYLDKLRGQCKKCALFDNCQTCMFQLDLSKETVSCPNFTKKEVAKKQYTDIITFLEENPNQLKKILYEISMEN